MNERCIYKDDCILGVHYDGAENCFSGPKKAPSPSSPSPATPPPKDSPCGRHRVSWDGVRGEPHVDEVAGTGGYHLEKLSEYTLWLRVGLDVFTVSSAKPLAFTFAWSDPEIDCNTGQRDGGLSGNADSRSPAPDLTGSTIAPSGHPSGASPSDPLETPEAFQDFAASLFPNSHAMTREERAEFDAAKFGGSETPKPPEPRPEGTVTISRAEYDALFAIAAAASKVTDTPESLSSGDTLPAVPTDGEAQLLLPTPVDRDVQVLSGHGLTIAAALKLVTDPDVPPDELHVVEGGKVVWKIVNIGPDSSSVEARSTPENNG